MKLGETILSLRRDAGYTQERLAEMLGVSTAAVSKWECGMSYPDITLLPKIAEVFECSVDYLLGYDITNQTTVESVINKVKTLHKEKNFDEAISLLTRALARYPGNTLLMFTLARHKYVYAQNRKKAERERMLCEAAELFLYVTNHDDNEKRHAWSLYFLVSISIIKKDYDLASEYNAKLLGVRGMYPRVTQSMIEMGKNHGDTAYHNMVETLYECIHEYSEMASWIAPYLFERGDNDGVIREYSRAAKVLQEFTDSGELYNDLSYFYEGTALAYANKGEYDDCLEHLEKAADAAILYEKQNHDFSSDLSGFAYDFPDNTMEQPVKVSARQSILAALESGERRAYDPIREHERFKSIVTKLTEAVNG